MCLTDRQRMGGIFRRCLLVGAGWDMDLDYDAMPTNAMLGAVSLWIRGPGTSKVQLVRVAAYVMGLWNDCFAASRGTVDERLIILDRQHVRMVDGCIDVIALPDSAAKDCVMKYLCSPMARPWLGFHDLRCAPLVVVFCVLSRIEYTNISELLQGCLQAVGNIIEEAVPSHVSWRHLSQEYHQ